MNLSFPSNDPLKSVIINSANNVPLYQTETHNLVDRTTQINKFDPGGSGRIQLLAEIHWQTLTFKSPSVSYKGQKMSVADYLRKEGFFKRRRVFVASDGRQYKWKVNSGQKFKLYDDSENVIVESHKHHFGILHKAQDYNIDVLPPALPILDDIIVAFVIVKYLDKRERQAANSAVGAAAVSS